MKQLNRVLLLGLIVWSPLHANDTAPIIAERSATIQILSFDAFTSWPDIGPTAPVAVQGAGNRLYLAWSEALISLSADGEADRFTLLSYWSSTSSESYGPWWGGAGDDGLWRTMNPENRKVQIFDPVRGESRTTADLGLRPEAVYPISGDALLILSQGRPYLWTPEEPEEVRSLADSTMIPGTIATSAQASSVVWWDPLAGEIREASLDDGELNGYRWSGTPPQALCRTDEGIVAGWPDSVALLTWNDDRDRLESQEWDLGILSAGWFQMSVNPSRIYLYQPQASRILLVSLAQETSEIPGTWDAQEDLFDYLLRLYTLDAASFLDEYAGPRRADAFLAWILPQVRQRRSRSPLDPTWPNLERQITDSRQRLRQ